MTEDQLYCKELLSDWVFGDHHLPIVHEYGSGICINYVGSISTFDCDRLTRLVLLAHSRFVRIEISPSGPNRIKIIAHRRKSREEGDRIHQYHPSIQNLIFSAEDMRERHLYK